MAKRCCRIYDFLIIDATAPPDYCRYDGDGVLAEADSRIMMSPGELNFRRLCADHETGGRHPFRNEGKVFGSHAMYAGMDFQTGRHL